MCGLIGYFTPRGSQPQILDLENALAAMSHRGPDGEDNYISPDRRFQAGFCRLSIIDLESGQQPIIDNSENRVLLGNGEIYNYVELKKEFTAYPFRSKGDMETILPVHGKHGDDFVHYLNGMYALALYERADHRLTLVRDRLGINRFIGQNYQMAALFSARK